MCCLNGKRLHRTHRAGIVSDSECGPLVPRWRVAIAVFGRQEYPSRTAGILAGLQPSVESQLLWTGAATLHIKNREQTVGCLGRVEEMVTKEPLTSLWITECYVTAWSQ